jgi:serine phosphatase RsbU (regulator of sigma subunit)
MSGENADWLSDAAGPARGLEVAHRYLPAGNCVAGGDWYDIVALPGGRAALIVGDAMGHGPEAAAVMWRLRAAAHCLAGQDLPPGEFLRRLDRRAAEMTSTSFATCVCAVLNPSAGSCVVARAGHHPPLLVLPGGAPRVLDLAPGLPLAIATDDGPPAFEEVRIGVPPGATLALYTDGLVESRSTPLERSMTALRDALGSALARPGATLDDTCAAVAEALRERDEEDDITLVLARVSGARRRWPLSRPAGPDSRGP